MSTISVEGYTAGDIITVHMKDGSQSTGEYIEHAVDPDIILS